MGSSALILRPPRPDCSKPHSLQAMRSSLVVVVGLVLTAANVLVYRFRPEIIQDLSLTAHDLLIQTCLRSAQSHDVAVVDIDEKSLEQFGQWPWPRYRVADLVDRLFEAGVSVVAFDILFAEEDGKSPDRVLRDFDQHFQSRSELAGIPDDARDFDAYFARSISNRNVVIGCFIQSDDLGGGAITSINDAPGFVNRFFPKGRDGTPLADGAKRLKGFHGVIYPIPKLATAAKAVGFINAAVDDDNIARRTELFWSLGDRQFAPSLSVEALRQFVGADSITIDFDATGIRGLRMRDLYIPTDPFGRMVLNYRSLSGSPPRSVRPR